MREIVIDTETTGLDPQAGHRIVEIAALELVHHVPTGRKFHCYVNPERDMPADAYAVHGLSAEFLAGHPAFAAVVEAFLVFVGDDALVIHNAEFDIAFLNAELTRAGLSPLSSPFVDTLALARKRFPGSPASLDALCRRFDIDLAVREKHGADIDCGLLAEVYVELLGGRQPGLDFAAVERKRRHHADRRDRRPPGPPAAPAYRLSRGTGGASRATGERSPPRYVDQAVAGLPKPSWLTGSRWLAAPAAARIPPQQLGEVDRVDQQGREAAVLRRIGDDVAREREEQPRRLDQKDRRQHIARHVARRHHRAIDQLDNE